MSGKFYEQRPLTHERHGVLLASNWVAIGRAGGSHSELTKGSSPTVGGTCIDTISSRFSVVGYRVINQYGRP